MVAMWIIWLILMVVFLVIEALTLGLTTVWCAAGCLVAMIMDLLGFPHTAQLVAMVVVSVICFIICIIWIKPQLDKKNAENREPTNADRLIGKEGIVIKTIDPIDGKGQVKVMGQVWSAKAARNIQEGAKVKVISLEGVKLFVEKINTEEEK
ncbi:MAG: NfeD family protein [Clostridiales bacterium]|nr:NfeD family protein [Clostridiales bacterium]